MLATTEKITKLNTCLSEREKESLACVEHILHFLQDMLGDEDVTEITSVDTGEVIDVEDIERARGLLDGILHSKVWTQHFKTTKCQ